MNYIEAEYLKLKRTFTKKLSWLAPVATILLCVILGIDKSSFQNGTYNWWYTLILPGMLTLISSGIVQKDTKKLRCRGILGLPADPATIWLGKIGAGVKLLFISCAVFFALVTLGGFVTKTTIPVGTSIAASTVIFLTFMWQIPLCMFLTDKIGGFATLLLNYALNVMCGMEAASSSNWWLPHAIPVRLMCPIIKVLPNSLPVPAHDALLSKSVILPGIMISIAAFAVLSVLTALCFSRREAK